jgi:hypothetical protein
VGPPVVIDKTNFKCGSQPWAVPRPIGALSSHSALRPSWCLFCGCEWPAWGERCFGSDHLVARQQKQPLFALFPTPPERASASTLRPCILHYLKLLALKLNKPGLTNAVIDDNPPASSSLCRGEFTTVSTLAQMQHSTARRRGSARRGTSILSPPF